ncbi:hypothetical protein ALI22I_00895 [Saccharothrix sp. ALI-22-I]|nr:hypothetical protein ALI22I_00895 [Saccharothrix sp. ALI-22-I]
MPSKVAKDRLISTVDTDARHGHKTSARGFDGVPADNSIRAGHGRLQRRCAEAVVHPRCGRSARHDGRLCCSDWLTWA